MCDSLVQDIPVQVNIIHFQTLNVHAKAAERQENSYDCGVFAIANAFTIACGIH